MFHSLAESDVVSGWEWYEQQQPGLGNQFVGATIAPACHWPNTGAPTIHDDHGAIVERKVATTGFPYAVRYRATDRQLIVIAVYHQHRHPDFGNSTEPVARGGGSGHGRQRDQLGRLNATDGGHVGCIAPDRSGQVLKADETVLGTLVPKPRCDC